LEFIPPDSDKVLVSDPEQEQVKIPKETKANRFCRLLGGFVTNMDKLVLYTLRTFIGDASGAQLLENCSHRG
jgi:hypothetical protein